METTDNKRDIKPISEFYSVLNAKCPRCRRGDMFMGPMYGLKSQKMYTNCSHCNLKYERELGYFYVSMFISYALNVAQMITVGILTYIITGNTESPWLYMGTIFPVVLILAPFNFRYSRVLLLHYMTPGLRYIPSMSEDKRS
jgi:uncharacterized protein (DUF983 family)